MRFFALTLDDVAPEQWGLVTTAQAHALGVSAQGVARLTNQGSLERMTHGVYRVSGEPPEPADELRAARLTLDPLGRAVGQFVATPEFRRFVEQQYKAQR